MIRSLTPIVALIAPALLLAAACGGSEPDILATSSDTDSAASAEIAVDENPSVLPGEGITVNVGRANWTTGYFQAAVYAALLEDLGYSPSDPATNEYPPSEAYRAMAEGSIDFWANGWYPQHLVWHEDVLSDGTIISDNVVVIGDQLLDAGLQGLVITKSVAEDLGITSLAQINDDPALAAQFDINGNGIGDIFGCPEDWTCDNVIDEMITFNDWTNLEQTKAGYDGMVATSLSRVNAGEPTVLYTWSPSGYLAELRPGDNVLWLSVGTESNVLDGSTAGGFNYVQAGPAPLGETCTADPCWPGWEVEDIRVTANRQFASANPAAVALFEVAKLTVGDIATQNARYDSGENTEEDVRRQAREWIDENRSLVDGWIAHALATPG